MKINKLISFVAVLMVLLLFVGVVSATDAGSTDNLEKNVNGNLAIKQSSDAVSGSDESNSVSEVLGMVKELLRNFMN